MYCLNLLKNSLLKLQKINSKEEKRASTLKLFAFIFLVDEKCPKACDHRVIAYIILYCLFFIFLGLLALFNSGFQIMIVILLKLCELLLS